MNSRRKDENQNDTVKSQVHCLYLTRQRSRSVGAQTTSTLATCIFVQQMEYMTSCTAIAFLYTGHGKAGVSYFSFALFCFFKFMHSFNGIATTKV